MLVLEGILINVFETPKGVTKDGKVWRRIKNSGHVRKHVGKRRKTHGNGDFDRFRYLTPYLGKKNAPVRVPVALNVYQGKAYLKATI